MIVEEVPVQYEFVSNAKFQMMHPERQVLATIHCGVRSRDKKVTVEKCARNSQYKMEDIDGKLPTNNT